MSAVGWILLVVEFIAVVILATCVGYCVRDCVRLRRCKKELTNDRKSISRDDR